MTNLLVGAMRWPIGSTIGKSRGGWHHCCPAFFYVLKRARAILGKRFTRADCYVLAMLVFFLTFQHGHIVHHDWQWCFNCLVWVQWAGYYNLSATPKNSSNQPNIVTAETDNFFCVFVCTFTLNTPFPCSYVCRFRTRKVFANLKFLSTWHSYAQLPRPELVSRHDSVFTLWMIAHVKHVGALGLVMGVSSQVCESCCAKWHHPTQVSNYCSLSNPAAEADTQ